MSEGSTGIRRKASFKSVFPSRVPGPNLFIIVYASSIEQYVKEYVKGSMKSLILWPSGVERWYIIRQPPSCFAITPSPHVRKILMGEFEKVQERVQRHTLF